MLFQAIIKTQFGPKFKIGSWKFLLLEQSRLMSSGKDEKHFRFTLDSSESVMSVGQRDFYETNGFLLVKNLVQIKILNECSQRFRDICEGKVDAGEIQLIKDISAAKSGAKGEYLYNKAQHFMWDDTFYQYCSEPQVLKYAQCITGENTWALTAMLINKPPDVGTKSSRHPLHQDYHFFPFRPFERIVCAWTAIENVNRENGCLVVLPGTHAGPLLPHLHPQWKKGVNTLYHGITESDFSLHKDSRVHLEMDAGDTVIFNPKLIHGSGANKTKGLRKAILCHYAAAECEFYDVHGTTKENVATESVAIGLKHGTYSDFRGYFKYHGRHVSGNPMKL